MDRDLAIGLAFLAVMLFLFGRYVVMLFRTLQDESTARRAAGRGHTWKDTAAILAAIVVLGVLVSNGVGDKTLLQIVMASIAVWYIGRAWKQRRTEKQQTPQR